MLVARLLPGRVKVAIALVFACAAGSILAVQARVNGELAHRIGPALVAALVSFGVGLIAIIAILTLSHRWSAIRSLRAGDRRLWWFGGGFAGAILVATTAYAVPLIGVALLVVALVAGQLAGGLFVDRAGIAPGGRRPVTAPRLAGAGLAIAAVLLSASGKHVEIRPVIIILASLAGFLAAIQQAANGHIRRHSDDALVAVLVNFVVGTAALLAICGLQYARGALGDISWPGLPLWLYAGGVLGVVFVWVTTSVVRLLGVLRLTLAVVAGQLFGAVFLDLFWRSASRPSAQLYAAVLLVLVAVAIAGRPARKGAR